MADWVECVGYTEERTKFLVNLDLVAIIKPHTNGSTLLFALSDEGGQVEYAVWDKPEDILRAKRRR